MITKYMKNILVAFAVGCGIFATTSCSDSYMESLNEDKSKSTSIEPSAQLTTALLQTYGDFGLMDTYRSYITGFTQHFAGGWNVSNYAGDVHPQDDQMRLVWAQFYSVGIKNIVDAIANSEDKPNTNAALRIHRVYMMSMLTDIYGDIPCMDAGKGFTDGIANPRYDKQEDIYNFFFEELAACVEQLGTGSDRIGGDVTSMATRPHGNAMPMLCACDSPCASAKSTPQRHNKSLRRLSAQPVVTSRVPTRMLTSSIPTGPSPFTTVPATWTSV